MAGMSENFKRRYPALPAPTEQPVEAEYRVVYKRDVGHAVFCVVAACLSSAFVALAIVGQLRLSVIVALVAVWLGLTWLWARRGPV